MTTLILYTALSTGIYYLAARAKITHFLWSKYPKWLDELTLCPACLGFWNGLILAATLGRRFDLSLLGLPSQSLATVAAAGLCVCVATPPLAKLMIDSLSALAPGPEDYETPLQP